MVDDEENLIRWHYHDRKSEIKKGVKINDKITYFKKSLLRHKRSRRKKERKH